MSNSSNSNLFFLKSEGKFYAVESKKINWIHTQGNYCTIHTSMNPSEFVVRISMTKIKEHLCPYCFVQTHRNYIVNVEKVEVYDPEGKIIIDNQEVPVSKKHRSIIEEKFNFLR